MTAFGELAKSSTTMLLPGNPSDVGSAVAQAMAIYGKVIWTMLMTMHVNFSFAHALDIYEKLMPLVTVMVVGQSTADSDSKISFARWGRLLLWPL